jgi:predicted nicotinamide N-methyase
MPHEMDRLLADLIARFAPVAESVDLGPEVVEVLRPPSAEALIDENDFARDERLPYWADLWGSAVVLGRAVRAEQGAGRSLLELGCGLGVAALAALAAGYRVIASDYYEDALGFAQVNSWRNLGRVPETRLLDWRALPDDLPRHDRVIAADVLYERAYGALVAEALRRALAPHGIATVADPGRLGLAGFLDACARIGLRVDGPATFPYAAGKIRQEIKVFTVVHTPATMRAP